MKEFLSTNWLFIIVVLVFVAFEIYLVVDHRWADLRTHAYGLMLSAERLFASGEGKKKFEAVYERIYFDLIPVWLRLFVPPESIREKTSGMV